MKKATECDGMPVETWKMLAAKDKGIWIVTDKINRIKREDFHVNGKLHYYNQFIKGMEFRRSWKLW